MTFFLLVTLGGLLIFTLGVLCGSSWANQLMTARSRRQARKQRDLNEKSRAIHARRAGEVDAS